ncbi:hypothetical protein HYT05_00290 [Candidatus Kaiserbacteria bacterium]|nr:hypothetical protein [Candidatus Kaiserbacteria bacterium]
MVDIQHVLSNLSAEMLREVLSISAAACATLGVLRYIRLMKWRGKRPERVSWFIWSVVDFILAYQLYAAHELNHQMEAAVTGTIIIALFTIPFGKPGIGLSDLLTIGAAGFGVFLWYKSDSNTVGILMSGVVILLGCIPTCLSVWEDPSREDLKVWKAFLVSSVFQIIALSSWTLDAATQPIVFLVSQMVVIYVIMVRSKARVRALA